jgi:hypothetical protein
VTVPTSSAGAYEFRLFLNDSYTRESTSPKITVAPQAPVIASLNPARLRRHSSLSLIVVAATSRHLRGVLERLAAGDDIRRVDAAVRGDFVRGPGVVAVRG